MKSNLAYKITGILAVLATVSALSAAAQDAHQAKPAVPPVSSVQIPGTGTLPTAPDPAAGAVAEATPETTVVAPKDFMQQAFLANEFGIAASQLALQQAQASETKDAAQQVLNDGLKVRADMVAAIQSSSSDMHFDQDWTDAYKQKLADLQAKSGEAFDAQYLTTQGEITNSTAELYSTFASMASDDAVKTFAANTLPILEAEGDKLQAASQGGQ